MAQSPLFETPHDRLGARLHEEVFGALPTSTCRVLDVPEVAALVRVLLAGRWRPAQLAARVGALPASDHPVRTVAAFLEALLERDSPQQVWERERAAREREQAQREQDGRGEASEAVRTQWAAHARRSLGLPARALTVPPVRPVPQCSACGGAGEFFVTREVRLCAGCVQLLSSGRAHLAVPAQAG